MNVDLEKFSSEVGEFWRHFASTQADDPTPRLARVDRVGDTQEDADELARLIVRGIKRGTAPLLWTLQADELEVPRAGALTLFLNWAKEPQCVVETVSAQVVPYSEVPASFAAIEGEGDGSLSYWRSVHWPYYVRECDRLGKQADETIPVVCEEFRLVFPPNQTTYGPMKKGGARPPQSDSEFF